MTRLAFVPRAWRATRIALHVGQGLWTTVAVFPFVDPQRKRTLIRRWCARVLALLNIEARLQGTLGAERGNVLIVANHVSWLDILVLNAQQPARFVAKSELAGWPLAGRLIRGAGTIFIARDRRHDTKRVNHHAALALSSGDVVAVFPEGTTTDGTTLLRFHASLLQPVVESKGHVQPVALRYRDALGAPSTAPAYGDETIADSFWRVCGERRLIVEVIASPPIAARQLHRRELARQAEGAIRTALALSAAGTAPEIPDVAASPPR
jgi:1-acyl-sn-glycerol-3-phosphate acyltransferase